MNIAIVCDKEGSALWRQSALIVQNNPHLRFKLLAVHPKRPDAEQLRQWEEARDWADLIHFQYWKTAELLRQQTGGFGGKKTILAHHNPYDLKQAPWDEHYTQSVVLNAEQVEAFRPLTATRIRHGVDLQFFTPTTYNPSGPVLMVAARIEGKKGILEVAQACATIGRPFHLVGSISKREYFDQVKAIPGVTYLEKISNENLREEYRKAALVVVNSVDHFESGPLPALEAMACGTPVLTRNVGLLKELQDRIDVFKMEAINADLLKQTLADQTLLMKMRRGGFRAVRRYDARIMARAFSTLYREVAYGELRHLPTKEFIQARPLVSVILPTKGRTTGVEHILLALEASRRTYPNIEAVVAIDRDEQEAKELKAFCTTIQLPVKIVTIPETRGDGYYLAEARNRSILVAEGSLLLFCDDRLLPDPSAILAFVTKYLETTNRGKFWYFGVKDGNVARSFVENFSFVEREKVVSGGLFNERIDVYGGQSEDIRRRFFSRLTMIPLPVTEARATAMHRAPGDEGRVEEVREAKWILHQLYDTERNQNERTV